MRTAKQPKPGSSLRAAHDLVTVARMRRDCYSIGEWSIMTDGHTTWLSKQKIGEKQTASIEVPKRVFDRLLDLYERPQPFVRR